MIACPRCGRTLSPLELMARYHACADGQIMRGCGHLRTLVTESDFEWLHDAADEFGAVLVTIRGSSGEIQPLLWRMAA